MEDEIAFGSALEIGARIHRGDVSAREVLQIFFDRIDQFNPKINAVVWQDRETAMAFAKWCDAEIAKTNSEDLPPLFGVPMTVKEHFNIKGARSTFGAPELADFIADEDCEGVHRLRATGVNIFGKSNLPYLGIDLQAFNDVYGTTLNPWSDDLTPGGSSGGSGAALAAGLTGLELGSDLGASIRYPAHCCGIFGLKPTAGTIVTGQSGARDSGVPSVIASSGPMARSARDLEAEFDIIAGSRRDFSSAWQLDCPPDERTRLKEFKVGVKLSDSATEVDDAYANCLQSFVDKLRAAGAEIEVTSGPDIDAQRYYDLYWTITGGERSMMEPEDAARHWIDVERTLTEPVNPRFWRCRNEGYNLTLRGWLNLMAERAQFRRAFDGFMKDFDVVVTPVAASRAFPHDHQGQRWHRTIPVNGSQMAEMEQIFWAAYPGTVGLPAIVGPAGFDRGVPVGYQAMAGFGRDKTAIAFAAAVENEIQGFVRPPEL